MLRIFTTIFLGITISSNCFAQFSPPGLGEAKTASWVAIGVKQNLNKKETISSATHLGLGRISDPDNYNLVKKQSIYVINEEISNRFSKNWKYSGALSYRWQNKYIDVAPYGVDSPKARQEIRIYGRFSYLNSFKNVEYAFSYRPELRFFYDPDFSAATEHKAFRSRFRGKASFNLNSANTHKIITSAEFLFSAAKTDSWSKFEYKETRFCLYYSVSFPKQKVTLNLGYMNDLLGKSSVTDVHYLACDLVVKNPFKSKKSG